MINATSPNDNSIVLARLRYEELLAEAEKERLIARLKSTKVFSEKTFPKIAQFLFSLLTIYVIFHQMMS